MLWQKQMIAINIVMLVSGWRVINAHTPKLTVVLVIDQCAYDYLPRVLPYMSGGIKRLATQGVFYTNAYYPHAMPATATGHTGLNTGTFAAYHGITGNSWLSDDGTEITADYDDCSTAAVICPTGGTYPYGKSSAQIQTDGISDQYVLASTPTQPRHVVSISIKSRAAICTAGRCGLPFWFDRATHAFTTSKAYVNELPAWLTRVNAQIPDFMRSLAPWTPLWPLDHMAYNSYDTRTYQFTRQESLIARTQSENDGSNMQRFFSKTPYANQLILSCASAALDAYCSPHTNDTLLLWVCLSALDHVGHTWGPDSLEALDMLYRLDQDLAIFINTLQTRYDPSNVLIALTADHGITPIIELLQLRGIKSARRILTNELTNRVNTYVRTHWNIDNIIKYYKSPSFYLNTDALAARNQQEQIHIIEEVKCLLCAEPGIKAVWSYDDLNRIATQDNMLITHYKNQWYPGRNGQLMVHLAPYTIITKYPYGSSHKTPYAPDTHVPLILYQPGILQHTVIPNSVSVLQLANTLAYLLGIPNPSASPFTVLPGIASSGQS